MELDDAGLPVREDTAVEVGRIVLGRSAWVVRVIPDGERGGEPMPLIDLRELVLPARVESERYRAPKGGARGQTRKNFEGWTRKGVRVTVDGAEELSELLARAAIAAGTLDEGAA